MKELFEIILYQPFFNGLVGLYNIIPDVGIVILIMTVVIKAVLYPLTTKSIKAQKSLQDLQPKLEEIKKKYKGEQQKIAQETMRIYKENKVNPLGSCLPILIQLPVFIALYWVLREALGTPDFGQLYSFIRVPESINPISLGFINLGKNSIILALLAGIAQFWQAKSMQRRKAPKIAGKGAKDENMMAMMNKQMLYFMPVLTVLIGIQLPGGLTLYWFLSTLMMAVQQQIMFRKKKDNKVVEGEVVE